MPTHWFRPKRYGYGATPITWQGWAVTLGTVLVMVAVTVLLRLTFRSPWSLGAVLGFDALALGTLAIVSYRKSSAEWRWRWGGR